MTCTIIDLPYHQQDDSNYCGLAVAQMILAASGAQPLPQDVIMGGYQVTADGISPDTLATILTDRWQPTGNARFAVTFHHDADTGMRAIADCLRTSGIPVPTLVFGGNPHWVAVRGVVLNGSEILGFFVSNPAPVTAYVLARRANPKTVNAVVPPYPLPHVTADTCGSGDKHGASFEYVSAYAWRKFNWPAAPPDSPTQICTILNNRHATDPSPGCAFTVPAQPAPQPGADPLQTAALRGIIANGLDTCVLNGALRGVQAALPEAQDNDAQPTQWFLVRMNDVQKARVADVYVESGTNEFLGIIAPPAAEVSPLNVDHFAFASIATVQDALADILPPPAIAAQDVTATRRRFWKPCAYSLSPYYAFIEVEVRNRKLYVGYDGRVHRALPSARCVPPYAMKNGGSRRYGR